MMCKQRLLMFILLISLVPLTAWSNDFELKRRAEMIEAQRETVYCLGGARHIDGMNLI